MPFYCSLFSIDVAHSKVLSYWLHKIKLKIPKTRKLIVILLFSCVGLSDITGDGDTKLVVADLGSGNYNMKLRVYKGTQMVKPSFCILSFLQYILINLYCFPMSTLGIRTHYY